MSIAQDVGQMVFGCYGGTLPSEDIFTAKLASGAIGGVLLGPWNLRDFTPPGGGAVSVQQLAAKLASFIKIAKDAHQEVPFIAADHEGGKVQRISPREVSTRNGLPWAVGTAVSRIPSAKDVAARNDATLARDIGIAMGSELRLLGFNLDFAPVADLGSGFIATGGRGYSTDPAVVSAIAGAVANGMSSAQVLPCIKHFPGHGATSADSHETIARITKTRAALESSDLVPFRTLASSVPMVMVGHLFVDDIDPTLPAMLSPAMINPILRQELGFTGVVITDDLFMMGARIKLNASGQPEAQERTTDEIVTLGLEAGVDIFLSQKDWPAVFDSLLGLSANPVHAARITESANRVRALKAGIPAFTPSVTIVDDLAALVASHAATVAQVNR